MAAYDLLKDDTPGVDTAAEFARLMEEEAKLLLAQRQRKEEEKAAEDEAAKAIQERVRALEEAARVEQARASALRETVEHTRKGAETIRSLGGAMVDVIQGRFAQAVQTILGLVAGAGQASVNRQAAGASLNAQGLARQAAGLSGQATPGIAPGTGPGAAGAVGGAAGAAGAAGGLARLAMAAGPAAAAIGAIATAASAAVSKIIELGGSALPGVGKAFGQVMTLLMTTIGQVATPIVVLFGATLLDFITQIGPSLQDLAKTTAKVASDIADNGGLLGTYIATTVKNLLLPLTLLEGGLRLLYAAFMKFAESTLRVVAWITSKIPGMGGMAEGARDAADRAAAEASGALSRDSKSIARWIGEEVASAVTGRTVGAQETGSLVGGGDQEESPVKKAMREFVAAARQLQHGPGRFEQSADTFRRIQQTAIGITSIEQKTFSVQQQILGVLEKMYGLDVKADARRGAMPSAVGP